ncbi:MAG: hypothetical protein KIY10_06640 [Thermoplasmata archaeon]|nr:hypothetical protein [Candidatus Sysuiplasma jiujiangense]
MNEKVSISLDENIIKLIDAERGDVPRSRYIENLLKTAGSLFEALWIFSDEFDSVTKMERWLAAHASQPLGRPLHKHEGYLSVTDNALRFYNDKMDLLFIIEKRSILNMSVSYDEQFKRFRDSRGLIPPLKLELDNRIVYLFTKTIGRKRLGGGWMFRGENEALEMWFKGFPQR